MDCIKDEKQSNYLSRSEEDLCQQNHINERKMNLLGLVTKEVD